MKAAIPTPAPLTEVYFTPVHIPDLNSIRELYLKRQSLWAAMAGGAAEAVLLTTDFGCPIYTARSNKKVIGYSYVLVNESGEASFRVLIDEAYTGLQWEHHLIALTRKHYEDNKEYANAKSTKQANERLVNWLNSCL